MIWLSIGLGISVGVNIALTYMILNLHEDFLNITDIILKTKQQEFALADLQKAVDDYHFNEGLQ